MAAAAVVGAVSSVKSYQAQKKAGQAVQRQQEVQSSASRRAAIREMQIKRAQTIASAQAAGVVGGSGVAGGLTSLSSQVGSNLGYSSQMSGLSKEISMFNTQAQTYGAVSGLAGTVFQGFGGWDALSTMMKPKEKPAEG
jgi:hypothetical protein